MKLKDVWSEKIWRAIRIVLALAIVVWLAHRVGLESVAVQLSRVDVPLLFAALLFMALDNVAKAWNWQHLLDALVHDQRIPFVRVLSWHFAGGFLGAVVPSSATTDAFRVLLGQNGLGGHGIACAASVVTLNGLGWFAGSLVGILGLVGLAVERDHVPAAFGTAGLLFLAVLIALPGAYALLASRRQRVMRFLRQDERKWTRLKRTARKFVDSLLVFQGSHARLAPFIYVSFLGLLAQAIMYALTAAAVGIHLPFPVWMIVAPLTRLIALVPISVADFGLIQAAHIYLLALFDVPPWQAFALSTLFALEGLLIHMTLGSVAFVYGGRRVRPQA